MPPDWLLTALTHGTPLGMVLLLLWLYLRENKERIEASKMLLAMVKEQAEQVEQMVQTTAQMVQATQANTAATAALGAHTSALIEKVSVWSGRRR